MWGKFKYVCWRQMSQFPSNSKRRLWTNLEKSEETPLKIVEKAQNTFAGFSLWLLAKLCLLVFEASSRQADSWGGFPPVVPPGILSCPPQRSTLLSPHHQDMEHQRCSYKALPLAECLLILTHNGLWHFSSKEASEAESLSRSKGKGDK